MGSVAKRVRLQTPYGVLLIPARQGGPHQARRRQRGGAARGAAPAPTPPPPPPSATLRARGDGRELLARLGPEGAPPRTRACAWSCGSTSDVLATYTDVNLDPEDLPKAIVNSFVFSPGAAVRERRPRECAAAAARARGRAEIRLEISLPAALAGEHRLRLAYQLNDAGSAAPRWRDVVVGGAPAEARRRPQRARPRAAGSRHDGVHAQGAARRGPDAQRRDVSRDARGRARSLTPPGGGPRLDSWTWATLAEFLPALALAIALAACAGLRAWLPLLLAGGARAARRLRPRARRSSSSRPNKALVLFGVATAIEMIGDKIPAVDHALDVIGTLLRPAAGALLAASVLGTVADPLTALGARRRGRGARRRSCRTPPSRRCARASTALTAGLANPVAEPARGRRLGRAVRSLAVLVPLLVVALVAATVLLAVALPAPSPPAGPPPREAAARSPRLWPGRGRDARRGPGAAAAAAPQRPEAVHARGRGRRRLGDGGGLRQGRPASCAGLGAEGRRAARGRRAAGGLVLPRGLEPGRAAERIPLSVVLVLDTSGSMTHEPALPAGGGRSTSSTSSRRSTARWWCSFNESVKGSAEFTGDTDRLERFVEGLQAWGGTSLYDAIHYVARPHQGRSPGRKAADRLLGRRRHHQPAAGQDVVDYARAVEATVYSIGFTGSGRPAARAASCARSPTETGGAVLLPDKVGELIKVFTEISNELQEPLPARLHARSARPTAPGARSSSR